MAAPVSRDSVLTAISVAPTSPAGNFAPVSNSGAFQGELKQATQAKDSSPQVRNESAQKEPKSSEKPEKSMAKSGDQKADLKGDEAAQSAELVRSQAEERADQAREDEGLTGSSQAAITPEDLAASNQPALGNTLPSPGEQLPLDQLAQSIAASKNTALPAETVQPAAASTITTPLPSNPQQTGQPVIVAPLPQQGQAVTPVASAADLAPEAEKSVPAPQVSAPVTSQVSGQQQTAVAKPDRPIEPVLPTTPIKDSGEASTVSVQPEVQGAKSAISAAQTNQVLQQQAQQNTQQPIQSTPNVTPSVSATEQVVASEVAQGVDNSIVKQVPKVTAEAASVQGVESASVAPEESVAKTELASAAKEPAALAVSKASVDPAPVTAAAVVQTNRQQEATPEVRVAKQDAPQPVKPAGVGETTLSINAAPASVAPQAVSTNLQGQQSDALNMNLQQMRAGIDISAQAAAQEGEARETDVAKTAKTSAAETVQHLNSMQNSLRTTSPVQLQLPMGVPPGSQNWGRAVADKVMIAASQNLRVANIHLDPPELGALQVRLQVNGDQQVNISFTSPAGSVRDALEQQMPRLREMLEEQGINLGQSDVSDQQNSNGDGEQGDGSGGYAGNAEGEPEQAAMVQRNLSLVDYYA